MLATLLAAGQGDIDSPIGLAGLGIAILTTIGLSVVLRRAVAARPALDDALAEALGDGRPSLEPRVASRIRVWRVLIAPLRLSPRAVERTRNIAFGPAGKQNLLDLYRNRSHPARAPAFIYFHPGGFFSGRKSREARPIIDQLVRHGWVCISANYRLRRAGSFPDNLIDAKLVVSWLRRNAEQCGADPNTLVVAGGSAGAYLAAMCALTANDPRFQPGFEEADTSVTAAIGLYGYYGPRPRERRDPVVPRGLRAGRRATVPGDPRRRDPMVPARSARRFAERLRDASSSPVVYAALPGGQHNFDAFPSIRCAAVADGIEAFTAWLRSRRSVSPPPLPRFASVSGWQ